MHIHIKVSADGDATHTGQLFFDPATLSAVYAAEPYAARGEPDQPNESDGIYQQSGGVTVVAVTVDDETSSALGHARHRPRLSRASYELVPASDPGGPRRFRLQSTTPAITAASTSPRASAIQPHGVSLSDDVGSGSTVSTGLVSGVVGVVDVGASLVGA